MSSCLQWLSILSYYVLSLQTIMTLGTEDNTDNTYLVTEDNTCLVTYLVTEDNTDNTYLVTEDNTYLVTYLVTEDNTDNTYLVTEDKTYLVTLFVYSHYSL